jgi:ubiquinone/menaquinone biosynthesis C-methylase UbiE
MVRRYVSKDAREIHALDLGCGAGGVMELLSGQVRLSVGVDPDLASLYGHRNREICLTAGRAERLPFDGNEFDLVTCSWVFEHLAEPGRVFGEMARVLRKGGHLVFLTPNARNIVVRASRLVPRMMQHRLVRLFYGQLVSDPTYLAFGEVFFWISLLYEYLISPDRYVHIVGDYVKA